MAKLPEMFDCRNVKPAGNSSSLPLSGPNGYPVIITASELKENKAKDGGFLELSLSVIDGEHVGSEGNYIVNLFSKSAKACEIAQGQLSALGHVCGQLNIADSAQLHGIPFVVVVGNQKLTDDQIAKQAAGETVIPFTEIKKVLHMDGSAPGKSTGAPAAAPQAPAAPPVFAPAPTAAVAQPAAPAPTAWGAQPAAQPEPADPATGAPVWAANPAAAVQAAPAWAVPK